MAVNLKGRSFLTLQDFTPQEIRYLLDLGHDLKAKRRAGVTEPALAGKHIVLLFEKTSTRTRCSFEVAATQEGAHVTYLDAGSSQMGKKESLEEAGIRIHTIPSAELSQGRGGPRCMSMPLWREDP